MPNNNSKTFKSFYIVIVMSAYQAADLIKFVINHEKNSGITCVISDIKAYIKALHSLFDEDDCMMHISNLFDFMVSDMNLDDDIILELDGIPMCKGFDVPDFSDETVCTIFVKL
jgi:hypothetical protein